MTMANEKELSLKGRALKLTTAQDCDFDSLLEQSYTSINFSGNTIGPQAMKYLMENLKGQLTDLYLDDIFTGRLLDEIPAALEHLVEKVLPMPIDSIDLSDNAFGPHGAKPLMKLLIENGGIRVLKLNNNGLGIQGNE
jgi:Ran GTPase-activating protein 1